MKDFDSAESRQKMLSAYQAAEQHLSAFQMAEQDDPVRRMREILDSAYQVQSVDADISESETLNLAPEDVQLIRDAAHRSTDVVEQNVFHVENAYGSVIGTNNTVTLNSSMTFSEMRKKNQLEDSIDTAKINEFIDLFEEFIKGQMKPQKGMFTRFSDVMERHSWLSGAFASYLVQWGLDFLFK